MKLFVVLAVIAFAMGALLNYLDYRATKGQKDLIAGAACLTMMIYGIILLVGGRL